MTNVSQLIYPLKRRAIVHLLMTGTKSTLCTRRSKGDLTVMNSTKRIAIVAAVSSLTLTPAMAVAEPINSEPISASHAVGGLGSGSTLIEAALPVGSIDTSPSGITDAAQAAGLSPEQAVELGRVVAASPAFGNLIGEGLRLFHGAANQIIAFINSLIPGLPGFPPPPPAPAPDPTVPPAPTADPTVPPAPTPTSTVAPEPTSTVPPLPEPTSTTPPLPTPTSTVAPTPTSTVPPLPTTTTSTPRPTVTATQPVPTVTGTQPAPTIPPAGCGIRSTAANPDEFAQGVFELINDYRQANGLHPLKRNLDLERTAEDWSNTMSRTNIPAHNPNLRAQVPECTFVLGENIGAGTGVHSPQRMFDNWRNSPGHNENLLRPEFTDIGIGIASNGVWTYGTMVGANSR